MLNIFHVRKIYDEGHSQKAVGESFGISQSTVAKYERERKVSNT